jgi:LysM repeat protein
VGGCLQGIYCKPQTTWDAHLQVVTIERRDLMRRTLIVVVCVVVMLLLTTASAYASPNGGWHTICVHRVQAGQTLLCIARAYGVRWQAIASYNGLANANHIYVGQRLYIPNAFGWNPAGPVCTRQCGPGPGPGCACRTYHYVQSGQNLYRIASWYGVNMWHVARCNGILNLNRIYVGQRLCIPY